MKPRELVGYIIDYLNNNLNRFVSIDELALYFGYEKSYIMKEVNFHVVEARIEENNIFSYANFCQNGPCDMCWGDLSL